MTTEAGTIFLNNTSKLNDRFQQLVKNENVHIKFCRLVHKFDNIAHNYFTLEVEFNEIESIKAKMFIESIKKKLNAFRIREVPTDERNLYMCDFDFTEKDFMSLNVVKSIKMVKKFNL